MSQVKREFELKAIFLQIKEWRSYLKLKRVTLFVALFLGMIVGAVYAWYKPTVYTAVSTFVLEDTDKSRSLGQYANIASMVGLDIGGSSSNGIFQGDNIIELYKSRSMIVKTLLTHAVFNNKSQPLVERYLAINPLRNAWGQVKPLGDLNFSNSGKLSVLQDSVLTVIVQAINKKELVVSRPDKKLSLISVAYTSKDEQFAKVFNDQIVKNVNDFYIQTKVKKSAANVNILQHQADSIRKSLNRALTGVAASNDANPNANPARQVLRVPSQKRQVDAEANKAILTELSKNLELGKITLRQETPLIQLIDEPVFPLEKTKFSMVKFMLLGGLAFLLMATIYLLGARLYQRIME
ncbi:GumC domain-containing protein [Pedobacter insulae]|uniref:Chain length determinant protein n=1 Tax=Pedobacter insulae TaxID=414048 RepID=A0A1I2TD98_9SPHI|nr:hypothetical protein [Pedobacter insulae]SFG62089.1 hypothetical protein SAMN04489864_101295 [Pedobacter insulae]